MRFQKLPKNVFLAYDNLKLIAIKKMNNKNRYLPFVFTALVLIFQLVNSKKYLMTKRID